MGARALDAANQREFLVEAAGSRGAVSGSVPAGLSSRRKPERMGSADVARTFAGKDRLPRAHRRRHVRQRWRHLSRRKQLDLTPRSRRRRKVGVGGDQDDVQYLG